MRRLRLLLPVVAGLLGTAAGVTTALVAPAERDGGPAAESFNDPLHLGIPLVDLECTGEALLVVARGDSAPPLATAVANSADLGLRYLRTDDSCPTRWGSRPDDLPEYVVYAGPFDSMPEPCEIRMRENNKGDAVTNLTNGNDAYVRCPCVLPVATFPELTPGLPLDPGSAIWVRSLQGLLVDLDDDREERGEPGPYFEPRDVTGRYDESTAQRIRALQEENDISPTEYGSVLTPTWRVLTEVVCGTLEF